MANNKIDLNKLKEEIGGRKRERNMLPSKFGESVGSNVSPRDSFLYGLIESINTGKETASTALMKTVDNQVAVKKGENRKLPINETQYQQPQPNGRQPQRINENDMYERDEQLFADLERRKNQTLAESINQYTGGANQMLNSNTQYPTGQLNEVYFNENVKKVVNGYLSENFGPIVEEAIKSTILEMYAVERIREVLHENKDLIRTVVIDTIKEIQARNKQKAQ